MKAHNCYLPMEAEIVERTQETQDNFTLKLRYTDPEQAANYAMVSSTCSTFMVSGKSRSR